MTRNKEELYKGEPVLKGRENPYFQGKGATNGGKRRGSESPGRSNREEGKRWRKGVETERLRQINGRLHHSNSATVRTNPGGSIGNPPFVFGKTAVADLKTAGTAPTERHFLLAAVALKLFIAAPLSAVCPLLCAIAAHIFPPRTSPASQLR